MILIAPILPSPTATNAWLPCAALDQADMGFIRRFAFWQNGCSTKASMSRRTSREVTTSSRLFGISLFAPCCGRSEFANDMCKIFLNR